MLYVHVEVKLKPLNTFSCVAIFILLRDYNSFLDVKDKVSFGSKSATSKSFNHDILKTVINYINETGRFDRPLICTSQ